MSGLPEVLSIYQRIPIPPRLPIAKKEDIDTTSITIDTPVELDELKEIISLHTTPPRHVSEVGGKGYGLQRLIECKGEYNVPLGFCCPVAWFDAQSESIRNKFADISSPGHKSIHDYCMSLKLTNDQIEQVKNAVESIILPNTSADVQFAVRSSAPEEDSGNASFAGMFETELEISWDLDALCSSIMRVWSSQYSDRVMAYRRGRTVKGIVPGMCIVVMEMVKSLSAGVCFTFNPISNDMDECVVEAALGLGEHVVNGDTTPDRYIVNRVEARVTKKTCCGDCVLTDTQAIAVATAAASFEGYANHDLTDILPPYDVEFAFDEKGKLLLLQARPATTWVPIPPSLMTPPGQPRHLYYDNNLVKQALTEPLSNNGADFYCSQLLIFMFSKMAGVKALDLIMPEDGPSILSSRGNGLFVDLSWVQCVSSLKKLGNRLAVEDPITAHIITSPGVADRYKIPKPANATMSYFFGLALGAIKRFPWWTLRKMTPDRIDVEMNRIMSEFVDRLHKTHESLQIVDQSSKGVSSLSPDEYLNSDWQTLLAMPRDGTVREAFILYMSVVFESAFPMILLSFPAILKKLKIRKILKADDPNVIEQDPELANLLAELDVYLSNNITTRMSLDVDRLAVALVERLGKDAPMLQSADDVLEALDNGSLGPDVDKLWTSLLCIHGPRSVVELDTADARFFERPLILLQQAVQIARQGHSGERLARADAANARRPQILQELETRLSHGLLSRRKIAKLRRMYHHYVLLAGYRELPKYCIVQVASLMHQICIAKGQQLVDQHRIDAVNDIFHLRMEQIDQVIADQSMDVRAIVASESAYYNAIISLKVNPPRLFDSRGRILENDPDIPQRASSDDDSDILQGVPVSIGTARGPAWVLASAEEGLARLAEKKDTSFIIVARALHPGAVASREMGIPCVTGIPMGKIADYANIVVDGRAGTVTIEQ